MGPAARLASEDVVVVRQVLAGGGRLRSGLQGWGGAGLGATPERRAVLEGTSSPLETSLPASPCHQGPPDSEVGPSVRPHVPPTCREKEGTPWPSTFPL